MLFDRQRNFNRRLGILRRGMRDGQDGDDCRVIALTRYAEDDDAGAVLAALFESGAMFTMPEVCVIEDKLIVRAAHPLVGWTTRCVRLSEARYAYETRLWELEQQFEVTAAKAREEYIGRSASTSKS